MGNTGLYMAGWLLANVITSSGKSFVDSKPSNVLLGHCQHPEELVFKPKQASHFNLKSEM